MQARLANRESSTLDLLPVFHDFKQDLVRRLHRADGHARRSLESHEVVLILIHDQPRPLESGGDVVPHGILGRCQGGLDIARYFNNRGEVALNIGQYRRGVVQRPGLVRPDDLRGKRVQRVAGDLDLDRISLLILPEYAIPVGVVQPAKYAQAFSRRADFTMVWSEVPMGKTRPVLEGSMYAFGSE